MSDETPKRRSKISYRIPKARENQFDDMHKSSGMSINGLITDKLFGSSRHDPAKVIRLNQILDNEARIKAAIQDKTKQLEDIAHNIKQRNEVLLAKINQPQLALMLYEIIAENKRLMLKASPERGVEEWAIHDYEGFEGIKISEYEGFEAVAGYAEFLKEHGALGGLLIDHCGDVDAARTALEDHYRGEYESMSDFAEQLTEETTTVPDSLTFYIDYEKMGRDLEMCDVFTLETAHREVHVFWNH